jgi:hypothetical protein
MSAAHDKTRELPLMLRTLLQTAFLCQTERDQAEADYAKAKKELADYLEKHPKDKAIAQDEGIRCELGLVTFQSRSSWSFNKRLLLKLIEKGELALETVLNLASFKADELRAAIGAKEFEKVAEAKETESLTLRKAAS